IKDAIEDYGIKYVLLAGGRKGQTLQWYVPTRRVNNDDGWETGYDSDLYFADIYDSEGNFSCWDPNKNNIFAEWTYYSEDIDIIDYYPNVYVGRLPFRYRFEVAPVVNKIIEYELNADDSWFKTGAVISGDTFPPSRGGAYGWWEGELATAETVSMLESIGFTMEKIWLSIPGLWETPQDVIDLINKGHGFLHFAGHSNPAAWGNYPPDAEESEEYVHGIQIWDMHKFTNKGKYPVVVLGGCHSAQFNVTLSHMIPHIQQYGFSGYFFNPPYRFYYMEWVPVDLSSRFVLVPESGGIACMGHAGLGYGARDEHWRFFSYWIEPRFFEIYANQSYGYEHLGDIHSQAIIDYLTIVGGVNKIPSMDYERNIDRKTIEGWVLLGDPTLRVGGI
ncbi:MAG: C25 family cysteine peptidase, partial [Candidatus Thermoplasmatota archaeon]|nr:C25 family cysteine peptidase [Candidatus Thermoplasmatota archaeon]